SRFTATAVYSRVTPRCASSASTLMPSATSRSLPFTVIFIRASPRGARRRASAAAAQLALPHKTKRPRPAGCGRTVIRAPCSLRRHYPEQLRGRLAGAQHDEADDRLALHLVGHADHARLGDGGMAHKHRLDLRGTEALAGDLERVVRASLDEPEAVPVHERPVTVDPDVFPPGPVRLLVASRVLPETLGHSRPRRRHHELAHLTAYRRAVLAEAVGRHPGDRPGERARFDRRDREAPEDAARDLGTARVVDDRQARLAGILEEPAVRFRVPGLARRAEDPER